MIAQKLLDKSVDQVHSYVSRRRQKYLRGFVAANTDKPYRLTPGVQRLVETSHGLLRLETAVGDFSGRAIYAYLPGNVQLTDELAEAFKEATDNRFVIEPNPGYATNTGEHPKAHALISAGIFCSYFQRWRKEGYWHSRSSAPTLTLVEQVLPPLLSPKPPPAKHF